MNDNQDIIKKIEDTKEYAEDKKTNSPYKKASERINNLREQSEISDTEHDTNVRELLNNTYAYILYFLLKSKCRVWITATTVLIIYVIAKFDLTIYNNPYKYNWELSLQETARLLMNFLYSCAFMLILFPLWKGIKKILSKIIDG